MCQCGVFQRVVLHCDSLAYLRGEAGAELLTWPRDHDAPRIRGLRTEDGSYAGMGEGGGRYGSADVCVAGLLVVLSWLVLSFTLAVCSPSSKASGSGGEGKGR